MLGTGLDDLKVSYQIWKVRIRRVRLRSLKECGTQSMEPNGWLVMLESQSWSWHGGMKSVKDQRYISTYHLPDIS
jgi:hypothetical protein